MSSGAGQSYDYVIVGAGSAGCVLANRLSENPGVTVLLIESGPPDSSPLIRMPRGYAKLLGHPVYNWIYTSGRGGGSNLSELQLRGRTLGGSSAVNGMVYMRGQPDDYDDWGLPGWGWDAFLGAFRAIERHEFGGDETRGGDGPLRITAHSYRLPLMDAAIAGGEALGAPRRDDLNAQAGEGIGYSARNIWRGRRQSAAEAFLKPIRRRRNLTIVTGADVTRLAFEGRRATGVHVTGKAGARLILANREVILAAGAINTPKLLQMSGVGPGGLLKRHGVEVVADIPQVGRNLSDHRMVGMQFRVNGGSDNREFSGWRLIRNLLLQSVLGVGPMSRVAFEGGAYVRTDPALPGPDARLLFGNFSQDSSASVIKMEDQHGMKISGYQMRPKSRGLVEISSADPATPPFIETNALTHEEDVRSSIGLVRYIRRLAQTHALAPFAPSETVPGAHLNSDDDILRMWRRDSYSCNHACSTCRMGEDAGSVVDLNLRVRGVEGLRVADISVLPSVNSGNTNAPAMALGWLAGEVIAAGR